MSRLHHKRHKEAPEIDVTTFLNLMVVLIPFLLVTAVFSRITIQELNLPESAGGGKPDVPLVTIEVIMRSNGLELADGKRTVAAMPKVDGDYDFPKLSEVLRALKEEHKEKEDATVLFEPDIPYDDMIRLMDAVKMAEVPVEGQVEVTKIVLFPQLSIGDAP